MISNIVGKCVSVAAKWLASCKHTNQQTDKVMGFLEDSKEKLVAFSGWITAE